MRARFPALVLMAALPLTAGAGGGNKDKGALPARAENGTVAITAEAFVDRDAIKSLAGSDFNGFYTVVRVTVTPKSKMAIQRDDFLLRTDKDGERTHPLAASEIAGRTDMTLTTVDTGTVGTQKNAPVYSGIPGMGAGMPSNGGFGGNGAGGSKAVGKINKTEPGKADPMYELIKQKILADKETDQPESGLLIFNLEKQKLKDLELIYTTAEGPLKLRFR